MLNHDEAQRLRREAPNEFDRRALEERNEFLFGALDCRDQLGREWGGEFRVPINQNVVLHFVPRYNDEMRTVDELPQFVVFADDDRHGEDRVHTYEPVKDLDAFDGVVFYVSQDDYRGMIRELGDVAARY